MPVIIGATRRGDLNWHENGVEPFSCRSLYTSICFHDVGFDDVAHALVVELLYLDAALVTGGDLLDVVLEAAQRGHLALEHDYAVAHDAHLASALDLAVLDVAAADGTDLADLVQLAYLDVADDLLLELGASMPFMAASISLRQS